ncbi:hypothetical protein F5141DRAFT_624219 [Pisolithus sp. B1]|nr:hypothetical protein F5141DRAFT_624219 [Pisolithus sp. B1]
MIMHYLTSTCNALVTRNILAGSLAPQSNFKPGCHRSLYEQAVCHATSTTIMRERRLNTRCEGRATPSEPFTSSRPPFQNTCQVAHRPLSLRPWHHISSSVRTCQHDLLPRPKILRLCQRWLMHLADYHSAWTMAVRSLSQRFRRRSKISINSNGCKLLCGAKHPLSFLGRAPKYIGSTILSEPSLPKGLSSRLAMGSLPSICGNCNISSSTR